MNDKLSRLMLIFQYWDGISECECHSEHPIGGCLKCDMQEAIKIVQEIKMENPRWSAMPSYGDVMTLQHWIECVESGGFIDYDGHGRLSDGKMESNVIIKPSDVTKKKMKFPEWATHVIWFNK